MRFRRNRDEQPVDDAAGEVDKDAVHEAEPTEHAEPTEDDLHADSDGDAEEDRDVEDDDEDRGDDEDRDVEDDVEDRDVEDDEEDLYEDPKPTGRFAWLKARKRKIEYGPDFTVKVATLPDLERFPEDGHVHPEIVRSWMALQQFGEAMLLVSWVKRAPVGYVLVSWTGDWNDEVRAEYPDVPALTNLWADERYVTEDVERKLIEAAITVCEKQGKDRLLATIESTNTSVRDHLEELGFEDTGVRTSERYVYRDAEGKKRRGTHENVVLLKEL